MLQFKNIIKSFPGGFAPVLNGIDLELHKGDFCIVVGANGSGKSTLLKVGSGEYTPDSGVVKIDGRAKSKNMASQVVQDVAQGVIPEMSLLENIALSQMHTKHPRFAFYSRYRQEAIQMIASLRIGLEEYIDQPMSSLSGGQRQIIATLMAIHAGRKVLLLDEHTSALDPKMQVVLMEYTAKAVAEAGLTTMMITHRMDDAIKYGNRLIMLHGGKIVFDVAGRKKAALKLDELLALFHKYEDLELIRGRGRK